MGVLNITQLNLIGENRKINVSKSKKGELLHPE